MQKLYMQALAKRGFTPEQLLDIEKTSYDIL